MGAPKSENIYQFLEALDLEFTAGIEKRGNFYWVTTIIL